MAKHILVVLTNAVSEEREKDFNDWYSNRHIHDVLKLPSFTSATRYVASAAQWAPQPPSWKYLAIYEVDDPAQAADAIRNAVADPNKMSGSDSLDISGISVCFYTPITERVSAKG